MALVSIHDRVETIKAIYASRKPNHIQELYQALEELFKAELMPHPNARKKWEIEQELNLKYVALTRAKRTLFLAYGDDDE